MSGNVLPLSFLLDVLNSPASARAQKLHAAAIACPFVHPRLNAVSMSSHVGGNLGGGGGGDIGIVQILAVPRGAAVDVRNGTVTIDGAATELSPVTPYEGTPPLELAAITDQSAPLEPPLPVVEMPDDGKVTQLNPYRRRSDDDDPAGAA